MGGMGGQGGRFYKTMNAYNINAEHVIHMSMSDGLDNLLVIPEPNRKDLIMFTEFLKKREY